MLKCSVTKCLMSLLVSESVSTHSQRRSFPPIIPHTTGAVLWHGNARLLTLVSCRWKWEYTEICSWIHLTVELQVIRSLHLNFAILSCLSPPEANELLEHIRCGSPYLNRVYAWDEYFMQSLETSTSQQHNQTSVNGITSGVGAAIPSLGTVTNGLYLYYFYVIRNVLLN